MRDPSVIQADIAALESAVAQALIDDAAAEDAERAARDARQAARQARIRDLGSLRAELLQAQTGA